MIKRNNIYFSEEGKVFKRISDGFIMGSGIDLGINDNINNYEEVDIPADYVEELSIENKYGYMLNIDEKIKNIIKNGNK